MLQQAKLALAHTNVDVELIDLRTLKPLDVDTIINSVKKTGRCVVVQEAPRTGGLSSEITAIINDREGRPRGPHRLPNRGRRTTTEKSRTAARSR